MIFFIKKKKKTELGDDFKEISTQNTYKFWSSHKVIEKFSVWRWDQHK